MMARLSMSMMSKMAVARWWSLMFTTTMILMIPMMSKKSMLSLDVLHVCPTIRYKKFLKTVMSMISDCDITDGFNDLASLTVMSWWLLWLWCSQLLEACDIYNVLISVSMMSVMSLFIYFLSQIHCVLDDCDVCTICDINNIRLWCHDDFNDCDVHSCY